jgi:hypothetical protein
VEFRGGKRTYLGEFVMIEYIFSSVSLLFLSIAMLALTYSAWRLARKIFNITIVVDLIFFFVFVKIGLYYFLPTLMRIGSDYQFEREDGVSIHDLVLLYSVELISWLLWIIALLIVFIANSKNKKKMQLIDFSNLRYSESKIILVVLALGFFVTQISALALTELSLFLEVFKALSFYAGVAIGPFLMVISLRYYGKTFFLLGVVSSLFALLSLSTRSAIVYMILFSIFLTWFVLRDRKSKNMIISTISVLMLSYLIFGGLFFGSIVIDESGDVSVDVGTGLEKKGHRSALEEIEWRFGGATRIGTSFINLYNRGESAGVNPIKHSFMGFLPRTLNPNKPHPSTLDGDDIYSQGMYVAYREIHGYNTYSMIEFPTGAHFYWEFGILGVLILSAISGLYVALCAHFFSKLGLVALPLMVAIFKPWGYMDPKIWVSDIAMQIYQIILPLILLVLVIRSACHGFTILNKSVALSARRNGGFDFGVRKVSSL